MLKVPNEVLDDIQYKHGQQPRDALREVFTEWKNRCSDCNWKSVLRMLTTSTVGRKDIANEIRSTF